MPKWLKRIRGAIGMGLIWAVAWAPVGLLIGEIVDPDGSLDEPWMLVGTLPGFIGGVIFSVVLGIEARSRRFDQLSIPRFGAWGAVAGLLVGVLPFVLGSANPALPTWLPFVIIGSITGMSAVSAAGSLALARMAEKHALPASEDRAEVRQAESKAKRLP
jgi:hypothetical protein